MTKIAILPVSAGMDVITYRAVAGERESSGRTAGEALDALTPQLSEDEVSTLVIVQHQRPDAFFGKEQQQRLQSLMAQWIQARDAGRSLSAGDEAELQSLVEAETGAAGDRAAALLLEATG